MNTSAKAQSFELTFEAPSRSLLRVVCRHEGRTIGPVVLDPSNAAKLAALLAHRNPHPKLDTRDREAREQRGHSE